MSIPPKKVEKLSTPTFLFVCLDDSATAPLRLKHLEGHLRHIENNYQHYRVAGPIRKDADTIIGSFFLVVAKSEAAARAVLKGDPYMASDMYGSVECHEIVPACGAWMGGVIWDRGEVMANVSKHV